MKEFLLGQYSTQHILAILLKQSKRLYKPDIVMEHFLRGRSPTRITNHLLPFDRHTNCQDSKRAKRSGDTNSHKQIHATTTDHVGWLAHACVPLALSSHAGISAFSVSLSHLFVLLHGDGEPRRPW